MGNNTNQNNPSGIGFWGALIAAWLGSSITGIAYEHCDGGPASVPRLEKKVNARFSALEKKLDSNNPQTVYVENVLGGPQKDTYVKVDDQRYFLKIDGKPVLDYAKK